MDFNGELMGFQWKYFGIKATWGCMPELTFVVTMAMNPPKYWMVVLNGSTHG